MEDRERDIYIIGYSVVGWCVGEHGSNLARKKTTKLSLLKRGLLGTKKSKTELFSYSCVFPLVGWSVGLKGKEITLLCYYRSTFPVLS